MDVINFLLHHLMWHVLLQMCGQKLPAARTCLTLFFCSGISPELPCDTVQRHSYKVSNGSFFFFFLVTLSFSTPRSHSRFLHGLRLKLRWERPTCGGSCGEEMDGSGRTAVSSNCKILVILDSASWLMGLIWRLPSFGPPLNTGGREEGITDHREEGIGQGRWRPDVAEPVRKCNHL